MKNGLPILLLFFAFSAFAQQPPQSFTVAARADGWGIHHIVAPGETVFSLSRHYHIPPAILAESNGLTYNDGLKTGSEIFLPLGVYNQKPALAANLKGAVLLLYKMQPQDNLYLVSRKAGVAQSLLQQWNGLKAGDMLTGKTLMVGSVLYDTDVPAQMQVVDAPPRQNFPKAAQASFVKDTAAKYILGKDSAKVVIDTALVKPVSALEATFQEQTNNGKNMVQEKVSAGFYQIAGNTPGAASFAFHNAAARGSIIRVKNIANGRVAFVKVLGPVPGSKQYAGCAIGLSNTVKAALGVRETKAFVELTYAGY